MNECIKFDEPDFSKKIQEYLMISDEEKIRPGIENIHKDTLFRYDIQRYLDVFSSL